MSDRCITNDTTGAAHLGAPEKTQVVARKGPRSAIISSAQFLPVDQRRAIYQLFQQGTSVTQLASQTRVTRLAVESVIRAGNEQQVRQARVIAFARRAA